MTYTDPASRPQHHRPLPEPDPEHAHAVAVADARGARMLSGTAQVLEGLMALGLLEHVHGPQKLLEAFMPDLPPGVERDAAMFLAGGIAGTSAGLRKARTRRDRTGAALAAAAAALEETGWEAMGAAVRRSLNLPEGSAPPPPYAVHPADPDSPPGGGPW